MAVEIGGGDQDSGSVPVESSIILVSAFPKKSSLPLVRKEAYLYGKEPQAGGLGLQKLILICQSWGGT